MRADDPTRMHCIAKSTALSLLAPQIAQSTFAPCQVTGIGRFGAKEMLYQFVVHGFISSINVPHAHKRR